MHYLGGEDLPTDVRLFPLDGALLLPGSVLPLNIFEPRYLQLFDDAMASNRVIGIIQPNFKSDDGEPISDLCQVGTLARIVSLTETGDGRYLVSLAGICRFRLKSEKTCKMPYRVVHISPFISDLDPPTSDMEDYKTELLGYLYAYVDEHDIEVDHDDIRQLKVPDLVNLLSSLIPFDAAEKQALLEAEFDVRVPTLIALLEMNFSGGGSDGHQMVQ